MDIDAGSLVYAIAGRDSGGLFVVLSREGEYCFLADGRGRKCDKPKKKKLKHCRSAGKTLDSLRDKLCSGEKITNSEIRKSLREFTEDPKL